MVAVAAMTMPAPSMPLMTSAVTALPEMMASAAMSAIAQVMATAMPLMLPVPPAMMSAVMPPRSAP